MKTSPDSPLGTELFQALYCGQLLFDLGRKTGRRGHCRPTFSAASLFGIAPAVLIFRVICKVLASAIIDVIREFSMPLCSATLYYFILMVWVSSSNPV